MHRDVLSPRLEPNTASSRVLQVVMSYVETAIVSTSERVSGLVITHTLSRDDVARHSDEGGVRKQVRVSYRLQLRLKSMKDRVLRTHPLTNSRHLRLPPLRRTANMWRKNITSTLRMREFVNRYDAA